MIYLYTYLVDQPNTRCKEQRSVYQHEGHLILNGVLTTHNGFHARGGRQTARSFLFLGCPRFQTKMFRSSEQKRSVSSNDPIDKSSGLF